MQLSSAAGFLGFVRCDAEWVSVDRKVFNLARLNLGSEELQSAEARLPVHLECRSGATALPTHAPYIYVSSRWVSNTPDPQEQQYHVQDSDSSQRRLPPRLIES
jgi:hypothetical protein